MKSGLSKACYTRLEHLCVSSCSFISVVLYIQTEAFLNLQNYSNCKVIPYNKYV